MPRQTLTASITIPGAIKRFTVREWTLEVIGGPAKGLAAATSERLLRIGADTTNDLVVADPSVSRRHVEIERTDSGFLVRDLDSHNGTYIDGRRVIQAWALPGEKIALGKTVVSIKQAREMLPTVSDHAVRGWIARAPPERVSSAQVAAVRWAACPPAHVRIVPRAR